MRLMLGRAPTNSGDASRGPVNKGQRQGTTNEATKVSCMLAIQEYIGLCNRLKILPSRLLEDIEVRGVGSAFSRSRNQKLLSFMFRSVF